MSPRDSALVIGPSSRSSTAQSTLLPTVTTTSRAFTFFLVLSLAISPDNLLRVNLGLIWGGESPHRVHRVSFWESLRISLYNRE